MTVVVRAECMGIILQRFTVSLVLSVSTRRCTSKYDWKNIKPKQYILQGELNCGDYIKTQQHKTISTRCCLFQVTGSVIDGANRIINQSLV